MRKYKTELTIIVVLILGLLLMGLTGCSEKWKLGKCRQWNCCPVVKDSIYAKDSIILTQHDTVIFVDPDTAALKMYFYCNELNEVIMREADIMHGRIIRLQKQYDEGQLIITAYKQKEAVRTPIRTKIVVRTKDRYLSTVQKEHVLSGWNKWMVNVGYICGSICLLLLLYIVYRIYRKFSIS